MNCEILHTLYLKSNGEILCNDDYGERIQLGEVSQDDPQWNISDIFNNKAYQTIRQAFPGGTVPWPEVCEHCAFLRTQEKFSDPLARKHLTKFQLEPSLPCNLNCRCCTNDVQIKTRKKPFLMPLHMYETVLQSLDRQSYTVDSIEYCGQGEPLMHPHFSDFITTARKFFPHTWQRVITNANFDYHSTLGQVPVNEIIVACDGVRQESYEQYRVGGVVEKPINFMRSVPSELDGVRQVVKWKYILFEFNDSDEEIIEAQHAAQELGVDSLLFVVTHSKFHSKKYTLESIGDLPVLYPNIVTHAHPSLLDGVVHGRKHRTLTELAHRKLMKSFNGHLDEVFIRPGLILTLKGWVAGIKGVTRIDILVNKDLLGSVTPTELRPDVGKVYPQFTRQPMGFRFTTTLKEMLPAANTLSLVLYEKSKRLGVISNKYSFEKHLR